MSVVNAIQAALKEVERLPAEAQGRPAGVVEYKLTEALLWAHSIPDPPAAQDASAPDDAPDSYDDLDDDPTPPEEALDTPNAAAGSGGVDESPPDLTASDPVTPTAPQEAVTPQEVPDTAKDKPVT